MLDFSAKHEELDFDLIPKGTLLWAVINLKGIRSSNTTTSRYLDLELTIDQGQPFERRKIFVKLGDPNWQGNSEEYRKMGYGAIRRILEAAFGANPNDPQSYNKIPDATYFVLHGKRVPVRITIEKGKDGYEDKNSVEFLSPHSSVKSVVKAYEDLKAGKHIPDGAATAKAPANAPAATPGLTAQAGPGWLAAAPATEYVPGADAGEIPFK